MSTVDSIGFVVATNVFASVPVTPRRLIVSSSPSRRLAAASGWVRSSFLAIWRSCRDDRPKEIDRRR